MTCELCLASSLVSCLASSLMHRAFVATVSLPLRPEQGFGQSPSCWRQGLNCIQQKQQFPPQSQLDQSGGENFLFCWTFRGGLRSHLGLVLVSMGSESPLSSNSFFFNEHNLQTLSQLYYMPNM